MLNKTPQLYYSLDDIKRLYPYMYSRIDKDSPIRLDFFVKDSLPGIYIDSTDLNIEMVSLTYKPLIFITKAGIGEIFFVADGAEKMFLNIGRWFLYYFKVKIV